MLTYELLYIIYFYIDDYNTANNFWILNKNFTINYMNIYNKNYEYKFKLLKNEMDSLFKCLTPKNKIDTYLNNHNIIKYKDHDIENIKFCYTLYKKFLVSRFVKCDFDYIRSCSWCDLLIFHIFHEGIELLDKICNIKFIKNKIIFESKFNKNELLEFLAYSNIPNAYYIKKYKRNIENALN